MNIPASHSWILKYCLPWVSNFYLARNYLSNEHHKNEIEAPVRMTVDKMHMHDFGSSCEFKSAVSRLPFVLSFLKFGGALGKQRSLLTRNIKVIIQSSFFIFGSSFHSFENKLSKNHKNVWIMFSPCPLAPEYVAVHVIVCQSDLNDTWYSNRVVPGQ